MVVLAVNAWDESAEDVRRGVKQYGVKHRVLMDGEAVYKKYGPPHIPCVLWIDRQGKIVDSELGFHGPEDLDERTKRLLDGSA